MPRALANRLAAIHIRTGMTMTSHVRSAPMRPLVFHWAAAVSRLLLSRPQSLYHSTIDFCTVSLVAASKSAVPGANSTMAATDRGAMAHHMRQADLRRGSQHWIILDRERFVTWEVGSDAPERGLAPASRRHPMAPAVSADQAPVPPPSYHRTVAAALYLDALTLVRRPTGRGRIVVIQPPLWSSGTHV